MKKVSTLVGIIIIVAVAVVAFGGVFAYQYFTAKTPTDQTAGWKTYTDNQKGFSLKYPLDFEIIRPSHPVILAQFKSPDDSCYLTIYGSAFGLEGSGLTRQDSQVTIEGQAYDKLSWYKGNTLVLITIGDFPEAGGRGLALQSFRDSLSSAEPISNDCQNIYNEILGTIITK